MKAVKLLVVFLALAVVLPACSGDGGRNELPVADAGADQTVMVGQTATLDASGSYDPEGETLTYTWELIQAPTGGAAALSSTSGVTVELTPDLEGAWVVRLVVNDGKMDSQADTVQVTATGDLPCTQDSDCDDDNVCTDDTCTAENQCQNTNNTAACDDGDACTMNDVCANGDCSGEPLDADGDGYVSDACQGDDCDDSSDAINPGAFEGPVGDAKCSDSLDNDCDGDTDAADDGCIPCTQDSDCDDGDVCNGTETCVNNQCVPGTALDCDDSNDCTTDSCDMTNGCQNVEAADGTECGTRTCNGQDWTMQTCQAGACSGTAVVQTCLSATTCLGAETCDPTDGCLAGTPAPDGTGCDDGDGDWCNSSCQSGVCTTGTAADCDDGLACNGIETCDTSTGCVAGTALADGAPCDEGAGADGDVCNSSCQSGVCTATAAVCDDANDCTTDSCDTTNGCVNTAVADDTECGSRFCNGQDWTMHTCQSGACTGTFVVQTCTGALVCSAAETCDPTDGCVAGSGAPDGTPCDEGTGQDGNWCNSSCQSQVCTAGAAAICDDGLLCNGAESCDTSTGCISGTALVDGTACDEGTTADSDFCNSSCQSGVCTEGTAPTCDDGLICNGTETCVAATGCQAGTAEPDGAPCDEGAGQNSDLCDSSCQSGACAVVAAVCDDGLICNGTEGCDSSSGCTAGTAEPDGTPCDEGTGENSNMCDSACQTGVCNPGTAVACDDGLICNGTESCDPALGCQPGTAAAAGTACDEGAGENNNPCDSSCQAGACTDVTPADLGQPCDDAYECTVNTCDGTGACMTVEDDSYCDNINAGDLCRPDCFGGATGCGTPPVGMTLVCDPNPVDLGTTDTSTCTVDLASVAGQDVCLDCSAVMGGVRRLDYTPFDACDPNGWALVQGNVCADSLADCTLGTEDQPCCYDTDPATAQICVDIGGDGFMRTNKLSNCGGGGYEEWRLQKTYDFTGLTGIEFCLDIASNNANNNQAVAVYAYDSANPTPVEVLCQAGEPRENVDNIFYHYCGMLPSWTTGSPDTTLTIIAHSENNGRMMLVDNISIYGWNDTCTPNYLTALTEDFTGCPDPFTDGWGGWTVTGTVNCTAPAFVCYDDSERIWVENNSASISTVVDTSALTGDVELCFFFGDDGNDAGKSLGVTFTTDGTIWQDAWNFSGEQDPDQTCREVCVNLSDIDPLAARNPALGLQFDLYSGRDPIYVDQITITGAEVCDAAGVVDLSTLTDNTDGTYTFTAQDVAGTPVNVTITCTWDDPPPGDEVDATVVLPFQ